MTAIAYLLLLAGALAGGFVSGLAGFGTALMALGIWLYVLPPSLAVPLVLICSVIAQTSTFPSIWRQHRLDPGMAVPDRRSCRRALGTLLIAHADPSVFKLSVGVLLLVFPAALYFQRAADGVHFRRADCGCRDRICRRHSGRPCRPVRRAADFVGQRARLGQGRSGAAFSRLSTGRAVRRALACRPAWASSGAKWSGSH